MIWKLIWTSSPLRLSSAPDGTSSERSDPHAKMDALATKLMVDGRFFCEIGSCGAGARMASYWR